VSKETLLKILGVLIVVALVWFGLPEEKKAKPGKKSRERKTIRLYADEKRGCVEPLIRAFEKKSGIRVAVTDRLDKEADLYWFTNPVRAELLKRKKRLTSLALSNRCPVAPAFRDPDGYWCGVAARLRLIVADVNTTAPKSVLGYADAAFRQKGAMTLPLREEASPFMAALFEKLGAERAEAFLKAALRNGTAFVPSDGEGVDLVVKGGVGFVTAASDEAVAARRRGGQVRIIYPDQGREGMGVFLLPSVVAAASGASRFARDFVDFLLSEKGQGLLAKEGCDLIPLRSGIKGPDGIASLTTLKVMDIDYSRLPDTLRAIGPSLRELAGE